MRTLFLFPVVTLVCVTLLAQVKSAKNPAGDWPTYNHDLAGTRYSPLTQITPSNVGKLKLAWGYRPSETGGRPSPQAVPLVVNGRMYLTAGLRIVALEPETGKEIWRYQVTGGNPSQRGVAYWPGDGNNPPRVIFTSGPRLLALNANTGVL